MSDRVPSTPSFRRAGTQAPPMVGAQGIQGIHGIHGIPSAQGIHGIPSTQSTQVPSPMMNTQGSQGSQGPSQELQGLDSWLTDRIVTVTVGPEEKRWVVHEKLLISQSDFFRDHFAQGDDEMKLPDDEPKLFALFIRWLYGTAFLPSGGARNFRFLPPDASNGLTVRDYLGVYIMGGKFGIIGVRNAVIDVLYGFYGEASDNHTSPVFHDITYVFEHTAADAPIRRFLIAHALFYLFSKNRRNAPLPHDWAEVLREHPDVGYEMVKMLGEWNWFMGHNAPRMTIKPRTEFHEHVPFFQHEAVKQEEGEGGAV